MKTWKEITAADPQHSINYARRWDFFLAQGQDIYGEARLIDAMAARGSRILDAGCGQGRLSGYLSQQGHIVVGSDLDPVLIDIAREKFPEATFYVGDLVEDPIAEDGFDIALCAGQVLTFLELDTVPQALRHIFDSLRSGGRAVIGFGAGRGLPFGYFFQAAEQVGFIRENVFSSWELAPFDESSSFLVAVLRKP
ncbi:SAM-dependent methyltransferase [Corynebacterium kutscheri]|uniref:Methyltransferase domain n=1 Tax=Corynebacterium kutscheri TaxID=35755 RepID=A0A0F6R0A4_9CORY|nr:class I SAM-dependent methyltransferase [Corynebacterium kutscheri]AKE41185.1 Methyltransferase domain [Corynebacterium kutscheri]VEH08461.1 SAM-dependent methyltransferase [Corynebacterium kutscheri]VEH09507.1 SAM-dependent methyltransferase [Corynebacterium kutscheri]VEH79590.1 SAM-dependent methyltransferase [Corynebacterium kutscheri]